MPTADKWVALDDDAVEEGEEHLSSKVSNLAPEKAVEADIVAATRTLTLDFQRGTMGIELKDQRKLEKLAIEGERKRGSCGCQKRKEKLTLLS